MRQDIEVVLNQIFTQAIITNPTNFYGLLEGNAGVALFCANYYSHNPTENVGEVLGDYINDVVLLSSENEQHPSLATGVTGVAYLLRYLIKMEVLDEDELSYLAEIDQYIVASLQADFKSKNYLLLYGAIGKSVYLFHNLEKYASVIEQVVDFLNEIKCQDSTGKIWWYKFTNDPNRTEVINLGMAHGISGILMFLMKCYSHGIKKSLCESLVRSALSFVLSVKKEDVYSLYPVGINDELNLAGRLAWCYGDLNIALIFFQASKVLNDAAYRSEGVKVVESIIKRNLLTSFINYEDQNQVYDPGFCHGTAGVAYILMVLHQLSGVGELERLAHEYLNYTLLATRVKLNNAEEVERTKEISGTPYVKAPAKNLIEGFSGIGLVLLSFLGKGDDWKELFLLDVSAKP